MKVLHLISEKPPVVSGFSRVIDRLARGLKEVGCIVDVLSTYDCKFKAFRDAKLVFSARRVEDAIRRGRYDVVNVHGHTPTFSDRLLVLSRLLGQRVVYTFHCPVGGFGPFSRVYNALFKAFLLNLADAVVFTSKSYYNDIHSPKRKYLVPWGVDFDFFSGTRIPHNGYRLLFVGQMRPYKGLKVLLRAVKGLDAFLHVVGNGPYRLEYELYARKLGLTNVRFHGQVSDEELRRLYLSSDVLVLPSVDVNEAFGLVALEAASAGCAVVASNLPGIRDVVGEFGVLVEPGNHEALRGKLVRLMDKDVREGYVAKGLKAVAKYSWRSVAEQYMKVYSDVASNS
ncbi:MAG: glycosyltransferase family 4 protein [Candidatus Nezhaarchaeales archaeon]